GAVHRQVMNITAGLVRDAVVALPPSHAQEVVGHFRREGDGEVGATRIGDMHVEGAVPRVEPRGGTDDLADQLSGKAGLWRMEQVEIPEIGDLHPPLSLFSPQLLE